MRYRQTTLLILLLPFASIVFVALLFSFGNSVTSQTRHQRGNSNSSSGQNSNNATSTATPETSAEVVKVDVDLVKVDALVLQKDTARIVGGLKKEDFQIYEDGAKQEITHFSQDIGHRSGMKAVPPLGRSVGDGLGAPHQGGLQDTLELRDALL